MRVLMVTSRVSIALVFFSLASVDAHGCVKSAMGMSEYVKTCQLSRQATSKAKAAGMVDPLLGDDEVLAGPTDCENSYRSEVARCAAEKAQDPFDTATSPVSNKTGGAPAGKTSALKGEAELVPGKPKAKSPANDFTSSTDKSRQGAAETGQALDEVARANDQIQKMADTSAGIALKRADQRLKQAHTGSASMRQAAKGDKQLAEAAKSALRNGQHFPTSAAEEARDEIVRKNLTVVSNATKAETVLLQEENRLSAQLATLLDLAATTLKRGTNMASESSPSVVRKGLEEEGGASKVAADKAAQRDTASSSGLGVLGTDEGPGAKDSSGAEPDGSKALEAIGRPRRNSLRSELQSRLAALLKSDGAEVIAGTSQFRGELTPEAGTGGPNSEPASADHALKSFLTESIRDVDADFSMPNAAAEAASLVRNSENELRELSGGILAVESPSLFVRISLMYRACLKLERL